MGACKKNLMLEKHIAGVRLEDKNFKDPVLVLIPAGEVLRLDRPARRIGRMQQVEWQGSKYGVLPQDLWTRNGSN